MQSRVPYLGSIGCGASHSPSLRVCFPRRRFHLVEPPHCQQVARSLAEACEVRDNADYAWLPLTAASRVADSITVIQSCVGASYIWRMCYSTHPRDSLTAGQSCFPEPHSSPPARSLDFRYTESNRVPVFTLGRPRCDGLECSDTLLAAECQRVEAGESKAKAQPPTQKAPPRFQGEAGLATQGSN